MSFLHNIAGTVKSAFRIGIGGPSIRQGSAHPSQSQEPSNNGDVFMRHNGEFFVKKNGNWVEMGEKVIRKVVETPAYSVAATDTYLGVNYNGQVTIQLPHGDENRKITIKDESGAISTSGGITVLPQSGQFIDGVTSYEMGVNYMSITLIFGNGRWFLI